MSRWPAPASGSRRRIHECVSVVLTMRRSRPPRWSSMKGARPRRYLRTRRRTPQKRIAVETTMRPYQTTSSQVPRPAKVSRVSVIEEWFSVELLELLGDLEEIGDGAVVGDVEDRSLGIRVDGDDGAARLHAGQVLHGAGDAHGEVDLRLHSLARLAHLARVRRPALVDERPRDGERRAHLLGQPLELGQVLLLADAATDCQEEVRGRDVDVSRRDVDEVPVARSRPLDRDGDLGDGRAPRARRRGPRRRADEEEDLLVPRKLELRVDLRSVERSFSADGSALVAEREDIAREPEPQLGGDGGAVAHRVDREAEEDDVGPALPDQGLDGLLVDVVLELLRLDADGDDLVHALDVDRVGEPRGLVRDHGHGHGSRKLLRRADELERNRPQLAAQVLGYDEDAHVPTCGPPGSRAGHAPPLRTIVGVGAGHGRPGGTPA